MTLHMTIEERQVGTLAMPVCGTVIPHIADDKYPVVNRLLIVINKNKHIRGTRLREGRFPGLKHISWRNCEGVGPKPTIIVVKIGTQPAFNAVTAQAR